MRFLSPSLAELHAFLAVCHLGSFRRAGETLCVTQVAVSRAVGRLEQRLECTLIDRSCTPVQPTARGRTFQALVESHVAGLESAIGQFGARSLRRKLRVSVVPTLCTRWLVPRLESFHALHPGFEIELRPFHHEENFARDDVDLWIRVRRSAAAWPRGIRATYLFGREMVPACTPALSKTLREPGDLLKATLLHHTNYPDTWKAWLHDAGLAHVEPKLGPGFDLGNNLVVAACSGSGVILIQPFLIESELASGRLVMPFEQGVDTGRGYYLCSRAAVAGSDALERFTLWLEDEARASSARFGVRAPRRRSRPARARGGRQTTALPPG